MLLFREINIYSGYGHDPARVGILVAPFSDMDG